MEMISKVKEVFHLRFASRPTQLIQYYIKLHRVYHLIIVNHKYYLIFFEIFSFDNYTKWGKCAHKSEAS